MQVAYHQLKVTSRFDPVHEIAGVRARLQKFQTADGAQGAKAWAQRRLSGVGPGNGMGYITIIKTTHKRKAVRLTRGYSDSPRMLDMVDSGIEVSFSLTLAGAK